MPVAISLTFLCITTYEKGQEFMRECKRQGCRVLLLTAEKLRDADWPRESLDETFYLPAEIPLADIVQGSNTPGSHAKNRPHRGARRVRHGNGLDTARAPPRSRDGPDNDALFSRQAGHADEGAGSRCARAGFCAGTESRRHSLLPGSRTRALGAEAAAGSLGNWHQEDSGRRKSCGRFSNNLGDKQSGFCWRNLYRAMCITWTRWSPKMNWSSPVSASTASRP